MLHCELLKKRKEKHDVQEPDQFVKILGLSFIRIEHHLETLRLC